jgi:hypothetical protein
MVSSSRPGASSRTGGLQLLDPVGYGTHAQTTSVPALPREPAECDAKADGLRDALVAVPIAGVVLRITCNRCASQMVARAPWLRSLAALLMVLGATACLGETTLLTPPKPPATTVTLSLTADVEDTATADALGWRNGIPDVAVTVTPQDSSSPPQQFQGSAAGAVTLGQLAGGKYVVEGVRWLTDAERAQLPAGDDAVGFVTRLNLNTAAPDAYDSVQMVASRRHGLTISEWRGGAIDLQGTDGYFFSGYVRLYNNTDSTIYLDGVLIGEGFAWQYGYANFPCSLYQSFMTDPLGIWARFFHQLPGNGRDYPLKPGATAVIATDAIDHRPLFPLGLDLRQANFELYDDGEDVDNPNVPNAPSVGPGSEFFGHGLFWSVLATVVWIARPVDLTTIHTDVDATGYRYARIPANALLDVMAIETTYPNQYANETCAAFVLPQFDRQAVEILGANIYRDDTLAYKRLELPFAINGLPVLQYTRTSAWDFTIGARTPFARP